MAFLIYTLNYIGIYTFVNYTGSIVINWSKKPVSSMLVIRNFFQVPMIIIVIDLSEKYTVK